MRETINLKPVPSSIYEPAENKPEIAIIYHMARTGGTLISKCIGCINGNILLSELNPALSVGNPIIQAADWFSLFSQTEKEQYKNQLNYVDAIRLVQDRVQQVNKKLIVRDWSHIDFTAVPFVNQCTYQFTQGYVLSPYFDIKQMATVRHPVDSFLSLSKLGIMQGKLDLNTYLQGTKQFAKKAKEIGFVRYEDFCISPNASLSSLCQQLNIQYNDHYIENFSSYLKITGDASHDAAVDRKISQSSKPDVSPALTEKFMENTDYWETLSLLGYDNYLTA